MKAQALLLGAMVVCGCSAMEVSDFAGAEPTFQLEQYFVGRTEGWGIMQDRFGTLRRMFDVEANGRWDEGTSTLRLDETYRFDDGSVDVLRWTIRRQPDGTYLGSEPSLEGTAEGRQAGNAFHWSYVRNVPQSEDGTTRLTFDDWFWLQSPDILISRASVQKFGFEVGSLSLFYRKP